MKNTSRRRRLTAALALAGLPLALLGFAAPAQATVVGHLLVDPSTGSTATLLDIDTLVKCPAPAKFLSVELTGVGIDAGTGENIMTGTTEISPAITPDNGLGGYHIAVEKKFGEIFQTYSITAPTGGYTLSVVCRDDSSIATGDEINATVNFTPTGVSFAANYSVASSAVATSTSVVSFGTPAPITAGTTNSLSATVTPATAAGKVQFKSGATNIGAPATIDPGTGVATLPSAVLPAGTNSVTAVFVPTSSAAYTTSASTPTSFVVAGPTSVSGTGRVGTTVSCVATSGGTKTYAWFRNGAATGIKSASVVVPATWAKAAISCDLTSTVLTKSVTRRSAARTMAIGLAPVARVKPKVLGTTKVGKKLTCSPGTWSPAATSYKYQWFRGAAKIAGRTAKTYKAVKADKHKKITCQVTAIKAGYTSGVAKAPARKVT